jgi:4-aminobutyrate aminotransferase-like enzyme
MNEILDRELMPHADRIGRLLKAELGRLMGRYPFIGDVRGKGLLLAFETVADTETMEPLPAAWNVHEKLVEQAYERGLIIYSRRTRDGIAGDHFMICPPMITNDRQVDEIIRILDDSLKAMALELKLPMESEA